MEPERERLAVTLSRAEWALAENLMPFWAAHAVDAECGGFLTRLDRRGNRLEDGEKILIMQVRMLSSLSAAHRFGLKDRGYLDLATQGFEFITKHMWDGAAGGFHYSVTREGALKCGRKNTDFHGYAIVGLVDYYLASGRPDALAWAVRVFEVLMEKAADRGMGFIEDFDGGDWPALNAEQMHLGSQRGIKTIDMHTNIMEGFTYLARATGERAHLEAVERVVRLIAEKGIDHEHGGSITAFDADWNPVADAHGRMTTSYGLNVEIAWLMLEALDALGEPREAWRTPILGLIEHALAFGFDHERGGLAAYGPMTGHVLDAHALPADRQLKPWWGQAELLNALVDAYEWTREPSYLTAFEKAFDWIWKHQIDHECGDWYAECHWDTGEPVTTDKGGEWKTSFHAGRALMRVCGGLRRLLATEAGSEAKRTA